MSTEITSSTPDVAAVAAFLESAPQAPGSRGVPGAPRPAVKAREVDHTFNPDHSAGLFTGVSGFFDAYGQPSTELHTIDFAVDDAVDLAKLFALDLELVKPANVRLALSGTPRKPESAAALAQLLGLGAKQYEPRFITVLGLLDEVSNLARADGILITSFATHGYQTGGQDHLLCQDSLLARAQASSLCVQELLGRMQEATSTSAKRRLVLIDACREFLKKSRGIKTEGLSDSFSKALDAAKGTVVLTGTVAGGFSYDDPQSKNGVFTAGVREGLLGAAGCDEMGFITPERLAQYLDERVASWVAKNRPSDREQSTGISKTLDGACMTMPLAVNHERWAQWRRAEDLKSKPSAEQTQRALARLDVLLDERAPVLRDPFRALRDQVLAEGGDERALARIDRIATEVLKVSFGHLALGEEPAPFETRDAFPGARPFLEEEHPFFFGREALVEQLTRTLETRSIVTLVGRSGCGKTSLVRAGLVPALRAAKPDLQFLDLKLPEPEWDKNHLALDARLPALEEALRQREPSRPLLLLVDRLSEVTLPYTDAENVAFLQRLAALAAEGIRLVLALREDYLGWVKKASADVPAILDALRPPALIQVNALEGRDLQGAIEQQAGWGHAVLDPPALGARIVREVQDQRCRMALVQRTLDELHHCRHGALLSESEYDRMGGIDGVVAAAAEDIYQTSDDAAKGTLQELFTRLLRLHREDATKDRFVQTEDWPFSHPHFTTPAARATVRRLEDERVLLIEGGYIQITHERLLDTWKRLRTWRTDDGERSFLLQRQELADAASTWFESKTITHRGDKLTAFVALREHPRLSSTEQRYLDKCFEVHDLERHSVLDEHLKDLSQTGWGMISRS